MAEMLRVGMPGTRIGGLAPRPLQAHQGSPNDPRSQTSESSHKLGTFVLPQFRYYDFLTHSLKEFGNRL